MKQLNVKFLLLLLVPVILLAGGIHFTHDRQVTNTEQMWLDAAKQAVQTPAMT